MHGRGALKPKVPLMPRGPQQGANDALFQDPDIALARFGQLELPSATDEDDRRALWLLTMCYKEAY